MTSHLSESDARVVGDQILDMESQDEFFSQGDPWLVRRSARGTDPSSVCDGLPPARPRHPLDLHFLGFAQAHARSIENFAVVLAELTSQILPALTGFLPDLTVRSLTDEPIADRNAMTAAHEFAAMVRGLDGVDAIYCRQDQDALHVWTFVPEPTDELLGRIYEQELEALQLTDEALEFSVHFCSSDDPAAVPASAVAVDD